MASLERQLEDTRSAASKDASNMEAQLKQTREALDSERAQAGFLRQQLQSATATADHEKQRVEQFQKVDCLQAFAALHSSSGCPLQHVHCLHIMPAAGSGKRIIRNAIWVSKIWLAQT